MCSSNVFTISPDCVTHCIIFSIRPDLSRSCLVNYTWSQFHLFFHLYPFIFPYLLLSKMALMVGYFSSSACVGMNRGSLQKKCIHNSTISLPFLLMLGASNCHMYSCHACTMSTLSVIKCMPPVCLSICPSVRLPVCPSARLSVCLSVYTLSVHMYVRPSVRPSVCLPVCLSVRPPACPSVCLSLSHI